MSEAAPAPKRFYRTTQSDYKIGGVCGGVARYLNMDPTLVRILWVVVTIFSIGLGVLAYVVFWVAAPGEDVVNQPPAPRPGPVHR